MAERYAVYFAPERGSDLEEFGTRWLGRPQESTVPLARPALPGIDPEEAEELTAVPRKYGFHGTLMPPFALGQNVSFGMLLETARKLAEGLQPFEMPPLSVKSIGLFLALVPSRKKPMALLAERCLRTFHPLREPPSLPELESRRLGGLSKKQERLLATWGYPYVLDEFKFHLTLTSAIRNKRRCKEVRKILASHFGALKKQRFVVSELCIFHQPDRPEPFRLVSRVPFGGKS